VPRRLRGIVLTVLLALISTACGARAPQTALESPAAPILILVSIDGWRWDYVERFAPPTLARLAREGVTADGLIPIFPSKTFPNHYSIVTGLHAAAHGITSNNMVDPRLPGRFTLSNRDVQQDPRWWGGEPLWNTAERQGLVSGTMFWPGSDVAIGGRRPTYWKAYDGDFPNEARVDAVLEWLRQPPPRQPRFVTMYFSDVDDAGHDFGPDGEQTRLAALEVDTIIGRLVAGIERLGLASRVNLVLVSDHGMSQLSPERVIVLDDYLDVDEIDLIDSAPIVGINPRGALSADDIYARLAGKHPALQVYRRSELPREYRLRGHPRMPAVIGIADDGWHTTTRARQAREAFSYGNHGYDPRHQSMHGLFIARGPAFKVGLRVPAFSNLHLYDLMCRILGLRPAPNEGDPGVTAPFLRSHESRRPQRSRRSLLAASDGYASSGRRASSAGRTRSTIGWRAMASASSRG
jgi:predicted AlkP superfamily pyrophosphatase or phosphodiesterase